jgi:predicted phosphodiesterase
MRLAFVSDIHGNLAALDAVIADMSHREIQCVVNLGDSLSGPLLPLETAARLQNLPWLHVAGNHERQLLSLPIERQNLSDAYTSAQLNPFVKKWLASHADPADPRLHTAQIWPEQLGHDVALCHGSPRSDIEYLLETPEGESARLANVTEIEERLAGLIPENISLLACGHSHVPRTVRWRSKLLIINPGSVGLPAYDDDHPYPFSKFHRIENGSPDARYAVVEKSGGDWCCELINVPYDHESMALLADERGRSDWAHALRTGWFSRV